MPRPSVPKEQKILEGQYLLAKLLAAQNADEGITQESLALELDMTQGNFNHWLKGRSHIPDKHFIWLGKRLGFDPTEIRPKLADYKFDVIMSPHEKRVFAAYQQDSEFRKGVDAIAEMSSAYRAALKDHPQS